MEASFSRRKLVTPAELKKMNKRSDLRGAAQMASHLGAIVLAVFLHNQALGTDWVFLTGFILGVLLNFLYAAQHELSHATVFATRKINEVFGRLIGFLMIFPRDFDQVMHFAHHTHTQNWEKDGELVREPYTIITYLLWLSGVTYWRNRIFGIFRRSMGYIAEPFIRLEEENKIIRESRIHLALYFAIIGISFYLKTWAALNFWILPIVLTKPIHQLQNTIEHLGLSHEDDILENTRSTRTNAMLRWLCWQMPYHTAHHIFPSVPFWKLQQLNSKIETQVGTVHKMGWIEFQIAIIRKLAHKDESQWPQNEVWIIPATNDRSRRITE